MTKEEIKQWLRTQIDSCVKIQSNYNKNIYRLCYNNSYIRALKLSKITGQPVNKNDFKSGESLFYIDTITNHFWGYPKIRNYLYQNYSTNQPERKIILEEVLNEYTEYKGYTNNGWIYE